MQISIGGYTHPAGEANLTGFWIQPLRSTRKFSTMKVVTAEISGCMCLQYGETQYDLAIRIQALIDALQDGNDLILHHDDATSTPFKMLTNDPLTMTGNQIVDQAWPSQYNGEFSTGKDFSYKVQNTYDAAQSEIIAYEDTIEHIGSCGPRILWEEHPYFAPTYSVVSYSSLQTIRHKGHAILMGGIHLAPADPILPPPFEIECLRTISRTTPLRYPKAWSAARTDWTYTYQSPTVFPAIPIPR